MSDDEVIEAEVVEPEVLTDTAGELVPTEDASITKAPSTELVSQEEMTNLVDTKIIDVVNDIFAQVIDDRKRAEDVFNELNELFLLGETDPDVLRELNKAQENIQNTSENLVKTLDKLAKLKTGAERIQIANINATKDDGNAPKWDKASLIDMVEELENE